MFTVLPHSRDQKKNISVSVVVTVRNEAATIEALLAALANQTCRPDQIIISDGSSEDCTVRLIERYKQQNPSLPLVLLRNAGNRSKGRNVAIRASKTQLVAITDAGCLPDTDWLCELLREYERTHAEIVAGYYRGTPSTPFERAQVPFVLVTVQRLNPNDFLPATRSMLLQKSAWEKVGGFDERLTVSEDFAFARRAKKMGCSFSFTQKALVSWRPRKNLSQFITMVSSFASGDVVAGIVRPKVLLVFARYALACSAIVFFLLQKSILVAAFSGVGGLLYLAWSIQKHKQEVGSAWYWLPVLQIAADVAVLVGTAKGTLSRVTSR